MYMSGSKPLPFTSTFDALVEGKLSEWHVPGLSVAVIEDSEVHSKAFGFSKVGEKKMTPASLLHTGSTTKAFLAAAWALEIEASNKSMDPITWKTPISSIIRDDFVLSDPYHTEHVTLEDALSHRTGLPNHGASFAGPQSTPKDITRQLRHLSITAGLREKWIYNNEVYVAVSHALSTRTKRPLEKTLREQIWNPLKMHHTFASRAEAEASEAGLARGYVWDEKSKSFIDTENVEAPQNSGAGNMISSVLDYAKWVKCLISHSAPFSKESHEALVAPMAIIGDAGPLGFDCQNLYALGWYVSTYRNEPVIWHGGGVAGFATSVAFLPQRRWGVVMMSNAQMAGAATEKSLCMYLIDELLETPQKDRIDWNARLIDMTQNWAEKARTAMQRLYPGVVEIHNTTLPLSAYTGKYLHPGYLGIELVVQGSGLHADVRERAFPFDLDLEHVSGDFFLATLNFHKLDIPALATRAQFKVTANGKVEAVGLELEEEMGEEKIWFRKVE